MIDLLRGLCGLIVTLAAILFSIANRAPIAVNWSPVDPPASVPVYAVALGALVIGFLLGGFMVWLNGGSLRREHRRQRRHIGRLEQQLEEPGRPLADDSVSRSADAA